MNDSKLNPVKTNKPSSASHRSSKSSSSAASSSTTVNSSSNNNKNHTSSTKGQANRIRRDNDDNPTSVMSNLSSYSLIDDDHIDDQETINVGNLIIDLESDLEKEKIENEQANAKPNKCSTTTSSSSNNNNNTSIPSSSSSAPASSSTSSSSSSSFATKPSSSLSSTTNPIAKTNQKTYNNNNTNNINNNNNIGIINSSSSNIISSNINSSTGTSVSSNSITSANSNNGHLMTTRTVFKSSADERGELKMRITRETKPGKSEHKIVTSPNQKSPTSSSSSCSVSSINNSNNVTSHTNNCEDIVLPELNSKPSQSSSISSRKECGTSTSIGTITEPDCLGPCEPGTSVTLEGIVWQETEGGILVVNVTWRGKTYVGALLDCTKHDWAPPRLCDSPASDIDSKTHKGVRTKRIVTRSNGIGLDEKNLLQTTGKLRNGKGRRIQTSNDLASCNKRQRESDKSSENLAAQAEASTMASISSITNSENACVPMNIDTSPATNNESISTSNISTDKAPPNSPMLIGCSEPNCSKKYRNMNGLLYHQAHAHGTDNESNNAQDNTNCSSISKEREEQSIKDDHEDHKETSTETSGDSSPQPEESRSNQDVEQLQQVQKKRRTPSPQLALRTISKMTSDSAPMPTNTNTLITQETRPTVIKPTEPDRRSSSNSNHSVSSLEHRRSPAGQRHMLDPTGQSSLTNSYTNPSKSVSSGIKQPINPNMNPNPNSNPLPVTTEEGMKPSGTSTGPPPAPHQANCYFNSAFLANSINPFGMGSYFAQRSPLPNMPNMYDPMQARVSPSNPAFIRFVNEMGIPRPPEPTSRLLSPSIPKNLPFPHYKVDPGAIPVPTSHMANPSLPQMSPLNNPPLTTNSPLLRMPSQVDPMLPSTSQPFPLPAGLNAVMGLPGPANPLGPLGGPPVPSLVDDTLAKQFPRRYN